MQKIKSYLYLFLISFLILSVLFIIGRYYINKSQEKDVNATIILNQIQNQYFLVTKTMILDEEIAISNKKVGGLEKFLFGDTVITRGKVRVDIGVDLQTLNEDDILVDYQKKKIAIDIPRAEILDASLFGEIKVEDEKGVWTNIRDFFLEDETEEYNQAVAKIINQAKTSAEKQDEIFSEARTSTIELLKIIVEKMALDYEIEVK